MRDRDAADDLFQETFVKIITKLQQGRYSPTGKFSAWIMRIAHNVIMDWYRAQRADKVIDAPKDNDLSMLVVMILLLTTLSVNSLTVRLSLM